MMHSGSKMVWSIAALLFLTACTSSSESSQNQQNTTAEGINITKTVMEVEKILDNYPELPRIERSEILSILQNITEEDSVRLKDELTGVLEEEKIKMQKNTTKKSNEESKYVGPGSLMVVMPFKPEDQQESLEELYTRSPIVRMEKQKSPIYISTTRKTDVNVTPPPGFSIVEKEDDKFSPPLRVIGFRYETTPGPGHTDNAPRTYTNFQNPEQVTKAFTTQQFRTSHGWNHKELDFTSTAATESSPITWIHDSSTQTTAIQSFHEPASMDNFSLEDVMVDTMTDDKPAPLVPTTLRNLVDISFTTPEITTEKVVTTTSRSATSTEKVTTTLKPVKQKHYSRIKIKQNLSTTTTSTTVAPKHASVETVLESLPPHLKEMLKNLGVNNGDSLGSSESDALVPPPDLPIRTINVDIDPSSYTAFKHIPVKRQKTISDDMQDLLASYGLLDGKRQQKAAVEEATTKRSQDMFLEGTPLINSDILTDSMKETLRTLGLYEPASQQESTTKKPKKKHVFNPKEHAGIQSDEEVKKLNALLTTIKKLASLNDSEPVTSEFQQEIIRQVKELDNITISYKTSAAINEEIHKIMARNKGKFKIPIVMKESSSINKLQSGLDPEFYEEIQLKNEVKRQENSTNDSNSSSATEGTTSTTEPANSAGLEDAFGGGDTAPQNANPADSLPPKRPNGLYLLLDWNTFFEVGTEDDARRVNIRFQPKIGDGRNFLPVAIP